MRLSLPLALILQTIFRLTKCDIVVSTVCGQLVGSKISGTNFNPTYYAFKGIPYAEPPVGDLRFRNPVPHRSWTGVRNATQNGKPCPTNGIMGISKGGDEDCLNLNVYTPTISGSLPVLFFVTGFGYLMNDASPFNYGPATFMGENIVLVTPNYRLGALGFLSTGDKYAQGNYGLKDAILALKWVHDNIKNFGGDPNKITLAGHSAGAISVHLMLIAEAAKNLFHQVIMMSGTAFFSNSFQPNPLQKAEQLARDLNIQFESTKDLMEKLRSVHFKEIQKYERSIVGQDAPLMLAPNDFVIVAEPKDAIEEASFTEAYVNLFRKNFISVPTLIGTTDMEAITALSHPYRPRTFDFYIEHPDFFVPEFLNISTNSVEVIANITATIRNAYFNGQKATNESGENFVRFLTDVAFKFNADRWIKMMLKRANTPVYYYEFSFDGWLGFLKSSLQLAHVHGVTHADDLYYLFHPESIAIALSRMTIPKNDHCFLVRDRYVRLISNFVKYGNPTPATDNLIQVTWPRYTLENEEYMDIGQELRVKSRCERCKVWYDLMEKYARK